MAAASSAHFFGLADTQMQPAVSNSVQPQPPAAAPAPKKKRNQPGNPSTYKSLLIDQFYQAHLCTCSIS